MKIKKDKTLGYLYFIDKNHELSDKYGKVYYHRHVAFSNGIDFKNKITIRFKDKNKENCNFDNLQIIYEKDKTKITCRNCGVMFFSKDKRSRVCSKQCRIEQSRVKGRAKRNKRKKIVTSSYKKRNSVFSCSNCKKLHDNNTEYCSVNCAKIGEYTVFESILAQSEKSSKKSNKKFELDVEHLIELWVGQGGRCYYSSIPLFKPTTYSKMTKLNPIYRPSLDRIDSSVGYTKGNVCWSSLMINYAKKDYDVETLSRFIEEVVVNNF